MMNSSKRSARLRVSLPSSPTGPTTKQNFLSGMMENHPAVRPPVAQGAAAQSRDIGAVEEDPALRRVDQPIGHAQKRGLAGAGAADDPEENAARDRHVGAVRPSPAAHSTQRDRSMPRSPLTAATASPASFRIRSSRSSTPAAARTTARSSGRRSAMRSRPLAPAPRRSTIPLNFRTRRATSLLCSGLRARPRSPRFAYASRRAGQPVGTHGRTAA
jgi:hypothetical protein